jgi:ubiquinone/menaquinone biosynthesis C-methylase UbiE
VDLERYFREEWLGVAPAWERWHAEVRSQSAAATAWLVELAGVGRGASVLDLASGVGDPALDLAQRVGKDGLVVATDLLSGPLEFTERAARAQGLHWLRVAQCDMASLPFADSSFDAVTCRFGLMFCNNLAATLTEIRRVLRPGGKAAFIVWGARTQPLFESTLGVLDEALPSDVSVPATAEPDAPGPFRFERAGSLAAELERARFREVSEKAQRVPWLFRGSPEQYFQMFIDLAGARLRAGLDALEPQERADLMARAHRGLSTHQTANGIDTGAVLIGASGAR